MCFQMRVILVDLELNKKVQLHSLTKLHRLDQPRNSKAEEFDPNQALFKAGPALLTRSNIKKCCRR